MKTMLLGAFGLASLAAGGFSYYHFIFQRSPQYSIAAVRRAVKDASSLSFERYVDLEALSSEVVDAVIETHISSALAENDNTWGRLGSLLGANLVEGVKPTYKSYLRSEILAGVTNGYIDSLIERASQKDDTAATVVGFLANGMAVEPRSIEGLTDIEQDGDIAAFDVLLNSDIVDTTLRLRLRMRRVGDRWQVYSFDDIYGYIRAIITLEAEVLKRVNPKVGERMAATLEAGQLRRRFREIGYSDYVRIRVPIKNIGSDTIMFVHAHLKSGGEELNDGLLIYTGDDLAPGASSRLETEFRYNQFKTDHLLLGYGNPQVQVTLIVTSAERLRFFESWRPALDWEAEHYPEPTP